MSTNGTSSHPSSATISAITALFKDYERILNTSDLPGAVALYTTDGVTMWPGSPPSVGLPAITAAYTALFGLVDHVVSVEVEEINVVGDQRWAFARTTCRGVVRYRTDGREVRDAVQQLWVLRKVEEGSGDGVRVGAVWRVKTYSFSPMGE